MNGTLTAPHQCGGVANPMAFNVHEPHRLAIMLWQGAQSRFHRIDRFTPGNATTRSGSRAGKVVEKRYRGVINPSAIRDPGSKTTALGCALSFDQISQSTQSDRPDPTAKRVYSVGCEVINATKHFDVSLLNDVLCVHDGSQIGRHASGNVVAKPKIGISQQAL